MCIRDRGHGISDVDTGELLHISKGALYQAEILGIQKGKSGSPGELSGLIRYEPGQIIGAVDTNSKNGIYGSFYDRRAGIPVKKTEVAYKQELEVGPASILCCVDGSVKEYDCLLYTSLTRKRISKKRRPWRKPLKSWENWQKGWRTARPLWKIRSAFIKKEWSF